VNEREPQARFYNGVGHQQLLDFLQLLLALLVRGVVLTSHRHVLEQLQYAHGCAWKHKEEESNIFIITFKAKGLGEIVILELSIII